MFVALFTRERRFDTWNICHQYNWTLCHFMFHEPEKWFATFLLFYAFNSAGKPAFSSVYWTQQIRLIAHYTYSWALHQYFPYHANKLPELFASRFKTNSIALNPRIGNGNVFSTENQRVAHIFYRESERKSRIAL